MKILYIAPVFKPAIGGGVVYLDMLSKYCVSSGCVSSFVIITEKFPGQPNREIIEDGKLEILRLFPFRAGRSKKDFISYLRYLWQNLQFLFISKKVKRYNPDVVFVHSSFHNHPNFLYFGLKLLKSKHKSIKLISDVRDPKLPEIRFSELQIYDKVISCSENVSMHLGSDNSIKNKIVNIPVPVAPVAVSTAQVEHLMAKFKLPIGKYLFNGSGCSKEKGILKSLELVKRLRGRGMESTLVVAGKKRYWDSALTAAEKEGWFRYIGEITHDEVIFLSRGSWLDINLSSVDSMPRHSLEAMSAGARVLLPTGVPEFDTNCPDLVAYENDMSGLVDRVLKISNMESKSCRYDWKRHLPDAVFPMYPHVLNTLLEKNNEQ